MPRLGVNSPVYIQALDLTHVNIQALCLSRVCIHALCLSRVCTHVQCLSRVCTHALCLSRVHSHSVPSLLCTPSLSASFGQASFHSHMRKFLKSASFLSPLSKTVIHFVIIIFKGAVLTWFSSSIHTHRNQHY